MSNYPPNGAPPWNGYGAPPPQGYGAPPPQGYGAPPPQGYGAPPPQGYGAPPSQGYGAPPPPQQGYGAPPQGYSAPPPGAPPQGYPGQQQGYSPPPQQGYSAPPQQQPYGYPPQPGNYAQPPPPGQYGPPQGYSQQGQYAQPPPPGQYGRLPDQGYGASPQAIPQAVPQGAGGLPMTPGNHSSNQNVTFYVEEKVGSATQDSFAVKDKNGRLIYDVVGSFTANEKKTMKDMHGKTLLQIREARLTVKEKITISSAQNAPLITIEQKSGMQMGNKTAVAYFGKTTKGRQAFTINGDRKATHFRVTGPSGNELAIIARKASSFKKKLTGQDSYVTTVMAGADHALMCMVTVACDEIWSD